MGQKTHNLRQRPAGKVKGESRQGNTWGLQKEGHRVVDRMEYWPVLHSQDSQTRSPTIFNYFIVYV